MRPKTACFGPSLTATRLRNGRFEHAQLADRFIFRLLLQQFQPFRGKQVFAAIAALNSAGLAQIPETNFEMFSRNPQELLEFDDGQRRVVRLIHTLGAKQGEYPDALALLDPRPWTALG